MVSLAVSILTIYEKRRSQILLSGDEPERGRLEWLRTRIAEMSERLIRDLHYGYQVIFVG